MRASPDFCGSPLVVPKGVSQRSWCGAFAASDPGGQAVGPFCALAQFGIVLSYRHCCRGSQPSLFPTQWPLASPAGTGRTRVLLGRRGVLLLALARETTAIHDSLRSGAIGGWRAFPYTDQVLGTLTGKGRSRRQSPALHGGRYQSNQRNASRSVHCGWSVFDGGDAARRRPDLGRLLRAVAELEAPLARQIAGHLV